MSGEQETSGQSHRPSFPLRHLAPARLRKLEHMVKPAWVIYATPAGGEVYSHFAGGVAVV